MQACDRATTERFGIASIELMRNAASAVAACAREWFPGAKRMTVLCGRGNNGGDGMMAARLLAQAGREVAVVLLGSPNDLKGDVATAWGELKDAVSCRIVVVETESDLAQHGDLLRCDLIIDAVVGTGFKPPLKGLPLAALEWVKRSAAPVLAVDVPSGWAADSTSASAEYEAFPTDGVVTFTAPKPAHVFGQLTQRWDQPVVVAPIGSPEEAVVSELGLHWAGSATELAQKPRAAEANKGNFGHVLVVGGSFGAAGGKAGAPAMTSMAAMRAGAGLVTAAVPAPALPVIASYTPELMTFPLEANAEGQANLGTGKLDVLLKGVTVLAIGPGLGQGADVMKFLTFFLFGTKQPVVIDADGLNNLAQSSKLLEKIAENRTVVLTPHPGEMARLAGISTKEVQANRLDIAREFAMRKRVHLVLKGARTLIAHPDGSVAVNTSGNPGMAKGGSGDVLTGIVAGMLAQFPKDAARAVEAAVSLHGLAADLTVRKMDEHTMLATDTLAEFSAAFRYRATDKNGYVWLQGMPAQGAGSGEATR